MRPTDSIDSQFIARGDFDTAELAFRRFRPRLQCSSMSAGQGDAGRELSQLRICYRTPSRQSTVGTCPGSRLRSSGSTKTVAHASVSLGIRSHLRRFTQPWGSVAA